MTTTTQPPSPSDALGEIADRSDDAYLAVREALMTDEPATLTAASLIDVDLTTATEIATYVNRLDRDALSRVRLDFSLCPLHGVDYAICFDDDEPECAPVRACFPDHDN